MDKRFLFKFCRDESMASLEPPDLALCYRNSLEPPFLSRKWTPCSASLCYFSPVSCWILPPIILFRWACFLPILQEGPKLFGAARRKIERLNPGGYGIPCEMEIHFFNI